VDRFDAEYTVRADGGLLVTERIELRFDGSWNGFIRTIPVRYRTDAGFDYRLGLDIRAVLDDAGAPLRHESSREGNDRAIRIWVPGAEDTTRVVVLRYDVANALRFFDAGDPEGARDELYWNVTGDEWEMPIRRASARVLLPAGATGVRAVAFTGAEGSTGSDAVTVIENGAVRVTSTRGFAPHEGLTLAVAWDPGVVDRPGAAARVVSFLLGNGILFIPIFAFFGMFRLWLRRGRDPKAGAVVVQYEPPHELTPAELGTLVDHSVDMRDVTATLVDLAVRGYLTIEEREQKKLLGLTSSREFVFHRAPDAGAWQELLPHEEKLLIGLFGRQPRPEGPPATAQVIPTENMQALRSAAGAPGFGGAIARVAQQAVERAETSLLARVGPRDSVTLSQLENTFYQHLGGIRGGVYDRLIGRGYYHRRPDHVKGAYVGVGAGIGALLFVSGLWLADQGLTSHVAAVVAAFLTAGILVGFGLVMPARTPSGAAARTASLGFREFLSRVESDRFRRMITSPAQFERFLPHAMALGVEDRWAAAFDGMLNEPPNWYRGSAPGRFRAVALTRSLGTMSTRAGSAMTSKPKSSGGSGFSGGRSGGGGGGGGGRGF
jgi:hypothetical protein